METPELRDCIWNIESLNRSIHGFAKKVSERSEIPLNRQVACMVMHLCTLLSDCWDTFEYDE